MVSKLEIAPPARILLPMTAHQNLAFQQLLSAWRLREEARSPSNIADLAEARAALDAARTNMAIALHTAA